MVKLSDNLRGLFPDLTFWLVRGEWNEKFQPEAKIRVNSRIFCTLENSISLLRVMPYLNPNGEFRSIEFWDPKVHNRLEWKMNGTGIAFAETGKIYRKNDLEELKRDYLIAKLSNLKQ